MKRKLSCFLFLFVVLVTFFNVVGCKDQSVIIYTVVFNPNGGELTSNNSQKILSGDNVIVPSDPKREEYIFTGWYTESECINLYDFNNQVSGSFTLYAGWSRIEYTIIFDANGGVFSGNTSEKILSGEKVIEPALEPCNTYCSFTGWYTEPECINLYDFNTPVTSSFTLYAGWTEVLQICINIKEDSVYMVPVPYGEKLPELEQPVIDGVYDFTGWYTEPECINLYDFNSPVTSSFTLYAGWAEVLHICINIKDSVYMVPVPYGEKLPELEQPFIDGVYDFTGWYTEPECINLYDFNTPVTSSFTLYAGWTEVYHIYINIEEGSGYMVPVPYGEKLPELEQPSIDGVYGFTGWYTEPECVNLYDFNTPVTSYFELYAGWIEPYYITIYENGYSCYMVPVLHGEKLPELKQPSPDGVYDFTGWYTEAECINLYDFNTPVTSSFTLYAGWTEVSYYTVTFNANGGWLSPYSSEYTTIGLGQTISQPSDPYSYCGIFTGWYTEPECINLYDFNSPVTSSFTLYAGWKLDDNYFSVTFNANGGTLTDVSNVIRPSSESISQPSDPIREGYYFTGWYTDVECTNKYEFNGQGINTSFTLYAGWATKPPCTVTFNANGGYFLDDYYNEISTISVTVLNGTCVAHPNNPSYQFMVFSGWYTESECKNKYDLNTPVTKNITLYAGWIPVHSINFESNGNSYFDSQHVVDGDLLICPDEIPENYGKVFTGWYTEPECTNLYNFNKPVTSSFTLYAGWGEKLIYYTITFDANGGTLTSEPTQVVLRYGKITEPINPTREGYTFTGWYDDTQCTDLIDFDYIVVDHDRTLYAGWTVTTYTVTFNANGGDLTCDTTQPVTIGNKVIHPSNPSRNEYIFTGWYTDSSCTNLYDFNSQVTSDFTLYAGWKIKTYTITFNANGGSLVGNAIQAVTSGSNVIQPNNPNRSGYTFIGWYTDINCTNKYDFTNQVTSNFTLYAGWGIKTYVVNFNANGGVLTGNTNQTVSSGSTVTQPSNPTRNEYDFTGWYTDIDCTNKYDFENQITSSFTLYAGWEIKNYTVSFNANGGTLTSNTIQTVSSGSKVTEPSNPTRNEYNFIGWYTDRNCTNKYDFTNQVTSNFTLYAGWKIKTYVVTFNATYGTLTGNTSQTVSSGGKVVQPSNPIHNKYNFTGWYTDSSCTNLYDFSLPVTTSFTLYAGWKSLEKYISYLFDSLEGEGPHDVILKGEFTDEIMDLLVAKIKESSVKVNLDLKNTTGLVVIDDFKGCRGLTSIKIPSTVTSIGAQAFSTTGLTSVYIPDSVTAIGPAAFFSCSKLTSLEIPLSVTTIGSEAFRMTGLTSIDIPASVKSIGQFAFDGCKKLISINIPTSVTTINAGAFSGCSELKSIEIPSSLKIIETGVFFKCTGLTTVEIPTSVTQIEPNAFYGCTGLTSITFKDTSTWYYSSSPIKIDGSSISVTSSSTNVINLIDTYASYYWHKE